MLFFGYPQPLGTKKTAIIEHAGPTSYTQFNTGNQTGGDIVPTAAFGMSNLEKVEGGMDTTGAFFVAPVKIGLGAQAFVSLIWFTASGMTQVAGATNLSTKIVALRAVGF